MKKLISIMTFLAMICTVPAWAFDINPENVTASKGATINVPVTIKNIHSAIEANAIGFTVKYDGDILSFVGPDIKGSLVESFTLVEGKENSPGVAKIGGSYFTDKVFLTDGLLLNITFKVKEDASGKSKVELSDFKDALKGATGGSSTVLLK